MTPQGLLTIVIVIALFVAGVIFQTGKHKEDPTWNSIMWFALGVFAFGAILDAIVRWS